MNETREFVTLSKRALSSKGSAPIMHIRDIFWNNVKVELLNKQQSKRNYTEIVMVLLNSNLIQY